MISLCETYIIVFAKNKFDILQALNYLEKTLLLIFPSICVYK